jgi:1-acyl-sn-glycerol-3-phosphate acyltransferase
MAGFSESFINRVQYTSLRMMKLLFGMQVVGSEVVPRTGGLLVASNHISELDPPIVGMAIPRTVFFMAKAELFRTRFGSFWLGKLGAFPVVRQQVDRDALRRAEKLVRAGGAVAIFPEGTRSTDGSMLPAKGGIGLLAIRCGVPILPVRVSGTDRPLKATLGRPPVEVRFGAPIPVERIRSVERENGFRAIASLVMEAVACLGLEEGTP